MPMLDLASLDLEASRGGRRGGAERAAGEGDGFLQSLLETPALQEAGIDEADLKAVLDFLGAGQGGKGVPLDGEALPEDLDGLSAKLEAVLEALSGVGEGDAEAALDGLDLEELKILDEAAPEGGATVQQGGSEGERRQELVAALLAGNEQAVEEARAALEAERQKAVERAEVLRALAELEDEGLSGRELVTALQERLADLEAESLEGRSESEEGLLAAVAGSTSALITAAAGEEGESLRSSTPMGDQIARELRAGGLLGVAAGAGTALPGDAGEGSTQGGTTFGGDRSGAHEALLQALQGREERDERGGGSSSARSDFSAALGAMQAMEGAQRSGAVQLSIPQSVGQQQFTSAVGERVVWMVNDSVQQARLQLNPPGLGPLDIQVNVGDERTTVNITAHSQAARDALEQDMERLRQFLADHGQEDVDVNVSQGEGGDDDAVAESSGREDGSAGEEDESDGDPGREGAGLIDHYA